MSRGTVRATGITQESAASMASSRPYRYRGRRDWNPASLGPMRDAREVEREKRIAEFIRLREDEGLSIAAASRAVGVGRKAGTDYELLRRQGRNAA